MKTIHKYKITPGDRLTIFLAEGAKVIKVGRQLTGLVTFCVEFDLAAEATYQRTFVLHGTGAAIPDHHYYVGSVLDDPFVWHLYEEIQEASEEE